MNKVLQKQYLIHRVLSLTCPALEYAIEMIEWSPEELKFIYDWYRQGKFKEGKKELIRKIYKTYMP